MKSEDYLLTTGDAARFLGVSDVRVRQLERDGKLSAIRMDHGRRQRLFKFSDLAAYAVSKADRS